MPELLTALNNHGFLNKCHDENIVPDTAVQSMIVRFPNAKDYIIRQYILSHDPVDVADIHIGNYEAKYDILSILLTQAGHQTVVFKDTPIDLCMHVLIHGTPGIGKTFLIKHLKQWFDVIEINASDTRTLSQIQGQLIGAGKMTSLSNKEQIVVFDEMDNMAKSGVDFLISLIGPPKREYEQTFSDSGGTATIALKKLFIRSSRRSKLHIMMLCNYINKITTDITTSDRVKVVEFTKPNPPEIESLLQLLSMKYWDDPDQQEYDESLAPSRDRIKQISVECNGDVRSAMEMLIGSDGYDADSDTRPLDYTALIFSSRERDKLYEALADDDISPTTICSYLAFNVTKFYVSESDITRAFDVITRAELLKFKTDVKYVWGVLVYGMPLSPYDKLIPAYPPRRLTAKQKSKRQQQQKQKKQDVPRAGKKSYGSRKRRQAPTEQSVHIKKTRPRSVL